MSERVSDERVAFLLQHGAGKLSDVWPLAMELKEARARLRSIEAQAGLARKRNAGRINAEARAEQAEAERDEALLQATFRENRHIGELGEKLSAALAERDALRAELDRKGKALYEIQQVLQRERDHGIIGTLSTSAAPAARETARATPANQRTKAQQRLLDDEVEAGGRRDATGED